MAADAIPRFIPEKHCTSYDAVSRTNVMPSPAEKRAILKTAVGYFSLEGNTRYAAEKIALEIGADLYALKPLKEYPRGGFGKYFWAGKSAMFKERPRLQAIRVDAAPYDLVVLGTPVWAGSYAPPLRTFFREHRLEGKRAALFACCSGGSADRCFEGLKREVPGCKVLGALRLIDPAKGDNPEEASRIIDFCAKLKTSLEIG